MKSAAHTAWPEDFIRAQAVRIAELELILDDLCDWAQHVAAPESDPIRFIVERAEAALKGERDA